MINLTANLRTAQGKGASRRLRHANRFPAIIYGGNKAAKSIDLDHDILSNLQKSADFYEKTIAISVDGETENVKVQAIQRHPFKPKLLHIDFLRV